MKFDNGGEYYDCRFEEFCVSQGIRKVKIVPRNPHQNGVAERMNKTILEYGRSMRIHAGLHKQFRADAVNTVVYLINRESSVPLNCEISEEA